MERETIRISKGQHLSDLFPEGIPSNIILHKTLCGIGATTLEINTPRNSIIIEPNVPVIKGKMIQHPQILGVYEGVTIRQIADYVNNQDGYCKIMTTPESFMRVRKALRLTTKYLVHDFFLLFDECEKIIQDVEYRTKITLPVNLFFECKRKAMVSATPIEPSDSRFEEQGFKIVKVAPDYPYQTPLNLFQTNNVFTLFSYVLQAIPQEKKVCIFFNSTNGIERLIEKEQMEEAAIYCSSDSAKRLRGKHLKASDDLVIENGHVILPKYSFFTSRFFSAVDIKLPEDEKPVIVILTELFTAPHSLIDPKTESVQIVGRFRNGVHAVYHIMNNDSQLQTRTDDELREYLAESHKVYQSFYKALDEAESEGAQDTLMQALQTVDYARFVTGGCKINTFMYDNAYNEEHIKALYKEYDAVYNAYDEDGAFNITWKRFHLRFSDQQRKHLNEQFISKTKLNRYAFEIIKNLMRSNGEFERIQIHELKSSFGLLIDAYHELGPEKVREIGFKDRDLKLAISEAKIQKQEKAPGVLVAVHKQFKEYRWYSTREINSKLRKIYQLFKVPCDKRGIADKISLYYEAERANYAKARGWKLGKALQ